MRLLKSSTFLALVIGLAGMPCVAAAQAAATAGVTNADIVRLEGDAAKAQRAIAQLRSRAADTAQALQTELDQARDDVTYYKVKLRRHEEVTRREVTDLGDRIDRIARRAHEDYASAGTPRPTATTGAVDSNVVPVGTELDVLLQDPLSSKSSRVEDRVEATTAVDLREDDRVLVPAGSMMRGTVTSVDPATRLDRKGSLTVVFDQITVHGRTYPMRATVTQAIESKGIRGETTKIGAGAGVGAILGGIIGGVKGALAGILIGAGGTIAATEGKDVELPPGTTLRVRLDQPLHLVS
ncbi:MAG: hypothetical protein IT176_10745 [Acidobacteria bacterium]|nr:hypothetical protein [Acidobacteriota bacterium]